MDCSERIRDLLPDYHLDQLAPDEAEEVRRHLRECEDCREALEEVALVLDLVPFGVRPATPPASLKQRALARALEQEPTAPEPRTPGRREDRRFSWSALAAAAALLVAALLGWAYLDLRQENRELRAEMRELRQEVEGERDLVVVAVEGTERAPEARGTAVVDPAGGALALDVYNLPEPPEGHSYRAWLVGSGGETVSLGPMELNERGDGRMTGEVSRPIEEFEAVAVTTEPAGSEGMSGPVYLRASL